MDSEDAAFPANNEERIFHVKSWRVICQMTEEFESMLFKTGSDAETAPVSQLKKMTDCLSLEMWQRMLSASGKVA
jgi:hypothetical protein